MILKYEGKQMSQKGNNEFYKLFEEIPHIFEFILSLTNRHLVAATVTVVEIEVEFCSCTVELLLMKSL